MRKMFSRYKVLLFLIELVIFSTVNAMTNVVLQNKMSHDLLIDSFVTGGSVVFNSSELIGSRLNNGESRAVQIGITSPECKGDENYVVLGVYNNNEGEYAPVILTWNNTSIYVNGEYVVDDFHRVSQKSEGSSIVITFYDDESSVRQMLRKEAISRLKTNEFSQQRSSDATILKYSGLKSNEILIGS